MDYMKPCIKCGAPVKIIYTQTPKGEYVHQIRLTCRCWAQGPSDA